MNLQDLKEMSAFRNDTEKAPRPTADVAILNMRFYAKELLQNYSDYLAADVNSRLATVLLDAMKCNLNDYVQTFVDVASIIAFTPSLTLKSLVTETVTKLKLTGSERAWAEFLVRRNEMIYDYLSRDFLNGELCAALKQHSSAVMTLVECLEREIRMQNLQDVRVRRR